jgi:pyridoxal 5'-phosphate synthase pdxT subunit
VAKILRGDSVRRVSEATEQLTRASTVGVLAMQGAFREHAQLLEPMADRVVEVRTPAQLEEVEALVIPGGESTAIRKQLDRSELYEPLRDRIAQGMPTLGTCAGLIVLANSPPDGAPPTFGLLDVSVERNGFGPQLFSFEAKVELDGTSREQTSGPGHAVHGVFIRAPRIERCGDGVEVIARLAEGSNSGEPVAVRQGSLVGCTFHPELAGEPVLHRLLMSIVAKGA